MSNSTSTILDQAVPADDDDADTVPFVLPMNPEDLAAPDDQVDQVDQVDPADSVASAEITAGEGAGPDKEINIVDKGYYADDLTAQEIAENGLNPEDLKEDEDIPVTSGELSIGDLDDGEEPEDPSISEDEENMAGGEDNVVSDD